MKEVRDGLCMGTRSLDGNGRKAPSRCFGFMENVGVSFSFHSHVSNGDSGLQPDQGRLSFRMHRSITPLSEA